MAYTPLVNLICPPPSPAPPPKFCITVVLYFSWVRMGTTAVPREIGNNACAHKMHHGLRLSHKATFWQLLKLSATFEIF